MEKPEKLEGFGAARVIDGVQSISEKNGHEFWFPESGREPRRKVLQYTGAAQ